MADSARKRRQSRGKAVKSYRFEDQYQFLDGESNDEEGGEGTAGAEEISEEEDDDVDVFLPDAQEEEQEEEIVDDDVMDEVSDAGSGPSREELEVQSGRGSNAEAQSSEDDGGPLSRRYRRRKERPKEVISSAATAGVGYRASRPSAKTQGMKVHTMGIDVLHARGVHDFGRSGAKEDRLRDLFGPVQQDLRPLLQTRDQWNTQLVLPYRAEGFLRRSFYVNEEARRKESRLAKEWYSTTGLEDFARRQMSGILEEHEARFYLHSSGPSSMNVLMGAVTDPQLYALRRGSYISTAQPFMSKEDRRGWVFNLGARIKEAQWAMNDEGHTQYLAVSVQQKPPSQNHKPMENPKAPAFTATKVYPSSIQVWAFESTEDGELDPEKSPRLELVICTDWGEPKQFRWCPVASVNAVETPPDGTIRLGLLAGIWSDGRVRILDVSYRKSHETFHQPQYIKYAQAAFEVQLPNTIATCLHWLSGTSLAVGTASGMLAIWTLTRPETFPSASHLPTERYNPQPWMYRQVGDTFIITLTSGYPSRPNYISVSTADGYGRLIDLRFPQADTVFSARGRIFATTQAWHEHTQSFVMSDESCLLRNMPIRRYYTNIYSMRIDSQIVCSATSPVQPCVLVGGADGAVVASNPVARVLNSKEIPWQHIWFTHEYRPPVDKLLMKVHDPTTKAAETATGNGQPSTSSAPTPSPPKISPSVLAQPLSRITEGYRVQQTSLLYSKPTKVKRTKSELLRHVTIYEEESQITCLAWNPNLKFGTWAVAGMGDGLLRVEDLGV